MKRSGFRRGLPWQDRHEVTRKARRPKPLVPKSLGLMNGPKEGAPIRDRQHMARVAEQPCLVCRLVPAQVHHIRECYPRTMGMRVGDDKTVPLCSLHHAELHMFNNETFWQRHRIDAKKWATTFYAGTLQIRGA